MSDGTLINNIFADGIHKTNAKLRYEEATDMINHYQRKLFALALTSGQEIKDAEGNLILWHEYVMDELESIFEDYRDQIIKSFLSKSIMEYPEDVYDELEHANSKMKVKDAEYVLQRINQEGFDYCFKHYSDFDEIKDSHFHHLREKYLESAKELEDYLNYEMKNGSLEDE